MIELKDYQKRAVSQMHNGCILCGGTGAGKSLTALGYIDKVYPSGTVYIIAPAKKRNTGEWMEDVRKFGMDETRIVVDSWNNLSKYKDIQNAFFLFDEQKVSGKGVWAKSMIRIAQRNSWILLSATPGDTYNDYATCLIANGFVRNRTSWYNDYCVTKSEPFFHIIGYRNEDVIQAMIHRIFIKMDYSSDKKRIEKIVPIPERATDEDKNILKLRKTDDSPMPFSTLAGAIAYCRMNCYDHRKKIEELTKIILKHNKVIVFYNFLSEKFEIERAAMDANVVFAAYNGQRHDEIPTGDQWVYAVQYNSGAEAWNCITTDTMVFYSPNYSYKIMEQAHGRIDRVNSPFNFLNYYMLVNQGKIDCKIISAINSKRDFNERILEGTE